MELRPPRWFAPLFLIVTLGMAAAAVITAIAAAAGPLGLWVVALVLVLGAAVAGAIAVIGTRSVVVRGGQVEVTGIRGTVFVGDELVGPLEQRLLGVRLADGNASRRVSAQLPHQTAALVARLPEYFPQLRAPLAYPVVLPGRISTPVTYGLFAAMVSGIGLWATMTGISGPGRDGPNRVVLLVVGVPMLLLGAGTVWWSLRRAERRVEVHADRLERVHLVGRRRAPLVPFAAAVVVRSARTLPKSSLEREVHHLRRVGVDGSSVELAPMLAAFPDYGAGEGRLMDERVWRLHRLADAPERHVDVYRCSAGEIALWDHSESSPGAHRHTLVLPVPVHGKLVVPLLHGRVAVGGPIADALVSYDDRMLVLVDLAAGECRHVDVGTRIRALEPGYRRVVTVDGPVDLRSLADAASPGWPEQWGPLGVPNTPWIPALDLALSEIDRIDDEDRRAAISPLVLARAHESVLELARARGDEPAGRLLAPLLELARLDDPDPVLRCSGAGRATVLGPDGRRECRGCGVAMSAATAGEHDWPFRPGDCDGVLRAPTRRREDALAGTCPTCDSPGPLSYDGLVRWHRRS